MNDVVVAWMGLFLGFTGIGATYAVVLKLLRSWRGGFR